MLNTEAQGRPQAKIRYALQPVPPKARTGDGSQGPYAAHVQVQSASLRSIAEQMVREGSKFSEAEILAMMTQMMDAIAYRLTNGETVNLGSMLRLRPAIRGTFESAEAPFDPRQHEVIVSANIGRRLRKIIQQTTTEQVSPVKTPELTQVLPFEDQSAEGDVFSFMVRGNRLVKHPANIKVSWFIQVANEKTAISPILCDDHKAVFSVNRSLLAQAETFQVGLQLDKGKATSIVLSKPIALRATC